MFMQKQYEEACQLVKNSRSIQIVTHIDADGLSAGGIISKALKRQGKDFNVVPLASISKKSVANLEPDELNIFTDLGSGNLNVLAEKFRKEKTIILDHHQVHGEAWKGLVHVNPCLKGLDGSREVSGAGLSYFLAKAMDKENIDLSGLAIVGAVGDIQNFWGKLEGINTEILKDAIDEKVLEMETDLLLYGRHTRPVYKSLQYFTDPFVPGISNNESGSISLLQALNIPLKEGDLWRAAIDLKHEERQKITSELIQRAMEKLPPELMAHIPELFVGDHYTNVREDDRTELKGVTEFSTCLNATGRNRRPEVGLRIAEGKRGKYYDSLMSLLRKHRQNIAKGLNFVEENGIKVGPLGYAQYFDAGEEIASNIIGTVAGMSLAGENRDPYKPMLGFSMTSGGYKISARCSRVLVLQKIDMANSLRVAAESFGGFGGGHSVACGGFIPSNDIEKFVERFERSMMKK
ncbi:MAG: DHH family phosphoesterase [archaeon]